MELFAALVRPDLERAADQDEVPCEDVALGVDEPRGGVGLHRLQQLLGGVQAGGEQLEAGQQHHHQVSTVLRD